MSSAYLVGTVVGAVVVGLLIGLIPFFIARKQEKGTAALICLLACTLANFILGLVLSVPTCLVCCIVLVVKNKKKADTPKICPTCGAPIQEGMAYCQNCGSKIGQ